MPASVFIATSLDGFIARADGALDWLPLPVAGGDDHGYHAFMASVDCLLMGRNTFDTALSFGQWPFGNTPVFVLTQRPIVASWPSEARVTMVSGAPREVMATLASHGCHHPYVDGGNVIQQFIAERLITRLIVTRVPVLLGAGIPLFGPLAHDARWTHRRTVSFADGLVQSEYALDV